MISESSILINDTLILNFEEANKDLNRGDYQVTDRILPYIVSHIRPLLGQQIESAGTLSNWPEDIIPFIIAVQLAHLLLRKVITETEYLNMLQYVKYANSKSYLNHDQKNTGSQADGEWELCLRASLIPYLPSLKVYRDGQWGWNQCLFLYQNKEKGIKNVVILCLYSREQQSLTPSSIFYDFFKSPLEINFISALNTEGRKGEATIAKYLPIYRNWTELLPLLDLDGAKAESAAIIDRSLIEFRGILRQFLTGLSLDDDVNIK